MFCGANSFDSNANYSGIQLTTLINRDPAKKTKMDDIPRTHEGKLTFIEINIKRRALKLCAKSRCYLRAHLEIITKSP